MDACCQVTITTPPHVQVIYNGMDVTGSVKNKASLVPAPGTSTLLEIPLAAPTASGELNRFIINKLLINIFT